jgi:hypothetical protein
MQPLGRPKSALQSAPPTGSAGLAHTASWARRSAPAICRGSSAGISGATGAPLRASAKAVRLLGLRGAARGATGLA